MLKGDKLRKTDCDHHIRSTHLEKDHYEQLTGSEGINNNNSSDNKHFGNFIENIKEEQDDMEINAISEDPLVMDEFETPQSPSAFNDCGNNQQVIKSVSEKRRRSKKDNILFIGNLFGHEQSKHKGFMYECNQREYQATHKGNLIKHQQSQHEGVRYSCNQCEYQATEKGHLRKHKQVKHEGVRYSCNQCDYHATDKSTLRRHRESKHQGIRYSCNQCEYKATRINHLNSHKQVQHSHLQ